MHVRFLRVRLRSLDLRSKATAAMTAFGKKTCSSWRCHQIFMKTLPVMIPTAAMACSVHQPKGKGTTSGSFLALNQEMRDTLGMRGAQDVLRQDALNSLGVGCELSEGRSELESVVVHSLVHAHPARSEYPLPLMPR